MSTRRGWQATVGELDAVLRHLDVAQGAEAQVRDGQLWIRHTCDPQIFYFRPQLAFANLPTLANDVKGLHVAACQFSKLFKHRV